MVLLDLIVAVIATVVIFSLGFGISKAHSRTLQREYERGVLDGQNKAEAYVHSVVREVLTQELKKDIYR